MATITLRELQTRFADAIFGHGGELPSELILADGMPVEARLDVYRNNILVSLQDVLKGTFPAVCRIVDERFFRYAAVEFITGHPPRRASLSAYGDEFANFLANFPACRELAYLADLARLEWLMHRAACAAEVAPLQPCALAAISPEELPNLIFRLVPSLGFLYSRWPVDRIWRANRCESGDQKAMNLDMNPVRLEVRRIRDEVVLRGLPAGVFEFRVALHWGVPVVAAADTALAADHSCDISAAFADLLREGAIVSFSHLPTESQGSRR